MPVLEVYRTETKYPMSRLAFSRLETRLADVLARDGFIQESGDYPVRSLYLDTPDERDFYQARLGVETRQKLRLRIYSPEDSTVKLECKAKVGLNQVKHSLSLSRDQAAKIMAGEFSFLLGLEDAFAQEMYLRLCQDAYAPRMLIQYRRIAYVAPSNHIRITFDSGIGYTRSQLDLFAEPVCFAPLCGPGEGVLEVKYDHFLFPYIREALAHVHGMPTSFGKYVLACERI